MLHILTLNWNGKDKLEALCPTLLANLKNIEWRWLIKDNASEDNSIQTILSWNNLNIIPLKYEHNNDTYSQGCNFLFKESNAKEDDYIMLLNNDIVFNNINSISNMINIIKNDKDVGVVGTKLLYSNRCIQHAGVVFNPINALPINFRAGRKDDEYTNKNKRFQAITGACLLTQARYYENITNNQKMKGLDEGYAWCFEDVSACLSIKYNLKKDVIYCANTDITHIESATLKRNPVNKFFLNQNITHFREMWHNKYKVDFKEYMNNPKYNIYTK